jgi:hypothetical protein
VHGEDLLTANAVGNTTNGDGLADAAALASDDDTLENLDSLTRTFLDADVNANSVANTHFGQLSLHILAAQSLNQIHIFVLLKIGRSCSVSSGDMVPGTAEDSPLFFQTRLY